MAFLIVEIIDLNLSLGLNLAEICRHMLSYPESTGRQKKPSLKTVLTCPLMGMRKWEW